MKVFDRLEEKCVGFSRWNDCDKIFIRRV